MFPFPSPPFWEVADDFHLRELARLADVPTHLGRSDVLIQFPNRVVVLEFKFARGGTGIKRLRQEGQKQIEEKGYARPYDAEIHSVAVREAGFKSRVQTEP